MRELPGRNESGRTRKHLEMGGCENNTESWFWPDLDAELCSKLQREPNFGPILRSSSTEGNRWTDATQRVRDESGMERARIWWYSKI